MWVSLCKLGYIYLYLLCAASSSAVGDVMDLPRQRLRNHVGQRFLLTDPPNTQLKHTAHNAIQFICMPYVLMSNLSSKILLLSGFV